MLVSVAAFAPVPSAMLFKPVAVAAAPSATEELPTDLAPAPTAVPLSPLTVALLPTAVPFRPATDAAEPTAASLSPATVAGAVAPAVGADTVRKPELSLTPGLVPGVGDGAVAACGSRACVLYAATAAHVSESDALEPLPGHDTPHAPAPSGNRPPIMTSASALLRAEH